MLENIASSCLDGTLDCDRFCRFSQKNPTMHHESCMTSYFELTSRLLIEVSDFIPFLVAP